MKKVDRIIQDCYKWLFVGLMSITIAALMMGVFWIFNSLEYAVKCT